MPPGQRPPETTTAQRFTFAVNITENPIAQALAFPARPPFAPSH
jgi:hypothetical protein